jgi:hypothetical protein
MQNYAIGINGVLTHYIVIFLPLMNVGQSGLRVLSRNYVSPIYGIFSLSFLLFFSYTYFSLRRGYCRVPKFCMGF